MLDLPQTIIIDLRPIYRESRKVVVTYDCNEYTFKNIIARDYKVPWVYVDFSYG